MVEDYFRDELHWKLLQQCLGADFVFYKCILKSSLYFVMQLQKKAWLAHKIKKAKDMSCDKYIPVTASEENPKLPKLEFKVWIQRNICKELFEIWEIMQIISMIV